MRICIIFNPTAKGNKARHFRRELKTIATQTELRLTQAPGEARLLTAVAVRDGVDAVVAAGGDGTVNEVLNGIGDAPDGFARVWLGILPLGTVNVFAKELGLPTNALKAWKVIQQGRARAVDLAKAEFVSEGKPRTRHFAQLAGAGLDARAIELVDWESKKRIGQIAYLVAGLKAMKERRPPIELTCDTGSAKGELVLIGNGRYYGGRWPVFPSARMDDGRLDVCVFPRVNWFTVIRYCAGRLSRPSQPSRSAQYFQTSRLQLTSAEPAPFEVEGEAVGHVPATVSLQPKALRVIVP